MFKTSLNPGDQRIPKKRRRTRVSYGEAPKGGQRGGDKAFYQLSPLTGQRKGGPHLRTERFGRATGLGGHGGGQGRSKYFAAVYDKVLVQSS